MSGYLEGNYVITNVTANNNPCTINDQKLLITQYGTNEDGVLVFRIFLNKSAITVTKVVVIEDTLTQDELESLLNGREAVFTLTAAGEDTQTLTLQPAFDMQTGKITAFGSFDSSKLKNDVEYTIEETGHPAYVGYSWDVTYSGGYFEDGKVKVTLTANKPTAAITCTNTYTPSSADLTITKDGWDATDENQSFVFRIEGKDVDMEVVIHGTGYVTIKGLPVGSYTVTEVTGWSWRYEPKNGAEQTIVVKATGENTLTFANTRENGKWLSGSAYKDNVWGTEASN